MGSTIGDRTGYLSGGGMADASADAGGTAMKPARVLTLVTQLSCVGLGLAGCSSGDGHPTMSDDVGSLVGAGEARGIGSVNNGPAPGSGASASQATGDQAAGANTGVGTGTGTSGGVAGAAGLGANGVG
jgi:hypothetical protein